MNTPKMHGFSVFHNMYLDIYTIFEFVSVSPPHDGIILCFQAELCSNRMRSARARAVSMHLHNKRCVQLCSSVSNVI